MRAQAQTLDSGPSPLVHGSKQRFESSNQSPGRDNAAALGLAHGKGPKQRRGITTSSHPDSSTEQSYQACVYCHQARSNSGPPHGARRRRTVRVHACIALRSTLAAGKILSRADGLYCSLRWRRANKSLAKRKDLKQGYSDAWVETSTIWAPCSRRRAGCQGKPRRLTRRAPNQLHAPCRPTSKRKGCRTRRSNKKKKKKRGPPQLWKGMAKDSVSTQGGLGNNGLSAQPTSVGCKETGVSVVA